MYLDPGAYYSMANTDYLSKISKLKKLIEPFNLGISASGAPLLANYYSVLELPLGGGKAMDPVRFFALDGCPENLVLSRRDLSRQGMVLDYNKGVVVLKGTCVELRDSDGAVMRSDAPDVEEMETICCDTCKDGEGPGSVMVASKLWKRPRGVVVNDHEEIETGAGVLQKHWIFDNEN